jgi:hypothetical protein
MEDEMKGVAFEIYDGIERYRFDVPPCVCGSVSIAEPRIYHATRSDERLFVMQCGSCGRKAEGDSLHAMLIEWRTPPVEA